MVTNSSERLMNSFHFQNQHGPGTKRHVLFRTQHGFCGRGRVRWLERRGFIAVSAPRIQQVRTRCGPFLPFFRANYPVENRNVRHRIKRRSMRLVLRQLSLSGFSLIVLGYARKPVSDDDWHFPRFRDPRFRNDCNDSCFDRKLVAIFAHCLVDSNPKNGTAALHSRSNLYDRSIQRCDGRLCWCGK